MSQSDQARNLDTPTAPQDIEACKLGHELGDCPLKRVGCHSLYDALLLIIPPWTIREYLKAMMGHDPMVRQWLARLDAVTPNSRPIAKTLDWWR